MTCETTERQLVDVVLEKICLGTVHFLRGRGGWWDLEGW